MADDSRSLRRRTFLTAAAALTTSIAGCADFLGVDSTQITARNASIQPPDSGVSTDGSVDGEPSEGSVDAATALVETMAAGDFEDAVDRWADRARAQVSPATIELIWLAYTAVGGSYVETVSAEAEVGSVDLTLAFERGEHAMRVSTTDAGEISGIFITDDYEFPDYIDETAFNRQTLRLETPSCAMGSTVALPNTTDDAPGAVIVHGSDPQGIANRDLDVGGTQMYRDIAEGLASMGVATFRYDRRTYACPNSFTAEEYTIDTVSVDDALAAVERFRRVDGVDPDRIYVVGHSLGAMAAPRIARRDSRLAGVVALASPARPFEELTLDQLYYQATVGEYESTRIRQQYERWRDRLDGTQPGEYDPTQTYVGYPGALWNSLAAYDHIETARQLDVPLLFLQGTRDFRVSAEDDFGLLRAELDAESHTSFELYDGLSHGFFPGEEPSVPQESLVRNNVEPTVIADIASWIGGDLSSLQQSVQTQDRSQQHLSWQDSERESQEQRAWQTSERDRSQQDNPATLQRRAPVLI